jgi:hypothetical protein
MQQEPLRATPERNHAPLARDDWYPMFASAYREAAAQSGATPNQMLAVTWQAVRKPFADPFKIRGSS